jgi:hypothetical protein
MENLPRADSEEDPMATTRLGTWAVRSFLGSVLLLALLLVAYNTDLLPFLAEAPGRQILGVVTILVTLTTLVTGAVSWLKLKDRSVLVVVATIYGVLATVLLGFGAMPQ